MWFARVGLTAEFRVHAVLHPRKSLVLAPDSLDSPAPGGTRRDTAPANAWKIGKQSKNSQRPPCDGPTKPASRFRYTKLRATHPEPRTRKGAPEPCPRPQDPRPSSKNQDPPFLRTGSQSRKHGGAHQNPNPHQNPDPDPKDPEPRLQNPDTHSNNQDPHQNWQT